MLFCQHGPCFYLCYHATSTVKKNMTTFAKIWSVGERYISHGIYLLIISQYYKSLLLPPLLQFSLQCIIVAVQKFMMATVEEIKGLSHNNYAEKGEVKNIAIHYYFILYSGLLMLTITALQMLTYN